jgi:protein-S-isoprenylcysteine O-methyltransferase Ste14
MALILKAVVATIVFYYLSATIYFFAAGRWDLALAWTYFTMNCLVSLALVVGLGLKDPGLLKERLKPGPGERDKLFRPVSTLMSVVTMVVAGVDAGRKHWWPVVPEWLQIVGLSFVFVGMLFLTWALFTNSFFSIAVRLQPYRQQVLVTSGPYAMVRHPGYTGGFLYLFFTGLALGSWWATLTTIPAIVLTVRRTLLEEAMLREGLPGYSEYAVRVRYRVLPGVW